jgi:hypothetical protein
VLYNIGFGLHHSGIEISGVEYSFAGGAGIFEQTPKQVPNAKYRESIDMGFYDGTTSDIKMIVSQLRSAPHNFHGDGYNLILKNCNHFANAFCWALLRKTIPGYVNRLADVGTCCSCLLPKKLLEDSPVNAPGSSGSVGGSSSSSPGFSVTPARNPAAPTSGAMVRPTAFSGCGATLGGESNETSSVLGKVGIFLPFSNSRAGGASGKPSDDLTDRREKARKAALARLEGGDDSGDTVTRLVSSSTAHSASLGSDSKSGFKES